MNEELRIMTRTALQVRIILSHTPYHHITYSVSSYISYPIHRIITSHSLYHHIPYSVSSHLILCILISHTPYHHIPYSVSSIQEKAARHRESMVALSIDTHEREAAKDQLNNYRRLCRSDALSSSGISYHRPVSSSRIILHPVSSSRIIVPYHHPIIASRIL